LGTVGLILGIIGAAIFVVQIILVITGVSANWVQNVQNER
jgi:hypothetical protein